MTLDDRLKALPIKEWKKNKRNSRMNYDQKCYSIHCDAMGIWVMIDGSFYGKVTDHKWFLDLVEEAS